MRAEHIKGWMAKARKKEKEEAVTAQKSVEEGITALLRGTGGEDTEERKGKAPADMSNWERVVDLVQADFGEEQLAN